MGNLLAKKYIFLFLTLLTFYALAEPGMVNCEDPTYCDGMNTYRPAFIFGAGPEGIAQLRESIYQNRTLISAVLQHELNTENENGLASQYILPIANNSFPITDPISFNQDDIVVPGLGYVLNPENFDSADTNAHITAIEFKEDNGFQGVNLNNFQLTNLTIDFSAFEAGRENPKALVCSHIGVDINTSFGIQMRHGDQNSEIVINDLDLEVDSRQSNRVCFNIEIDLGNFQVKNIERVATEPILTREQIDEAFAKESLSFDIPSTSPLSDLPSDLLRSTIGRYVAPVIASDDISQMIEAPLIESVQDILSTQVNGYLTALFESNAAGEIALPALNIPNVQLASAIQENILGANLLMNENEKCKNIYRRVNNIIYWSNRHTNFRDATIAQSMNELRERVSNYSRCNNYRDIDERLRLLNLKANDVTPRLTEAENLIMHQLPSLTDGNLSVEVFIPELCSGDFNPALAQGSQLAQCDQFHTMMDLSYINNFLQQQRDKGNLCQSFQNGNCAITVMEHTNEEVDEDTDVDFACEDLQGVTTEMTSDGKMRVRANLNDCRGGETSGFNIFGITDFNSTDFEIVFDVELKADCPNGQKACFEFEMNEELLTYNGGLRAEALEGTISGKIRDAFAEFGEVTLQDQFNNFPITQMLQGLDVDSFFGSPVPGSPGYIGICLEVNQESETNNRYCELARLRLPANHSALSGCPAP